MTTQSQGNTAQNIPFVTHLTTHQVDALRIRAAAAGKTETQLAAEMINDGLHLTPKPRPTQATIDRVVAEIKSASYGIEVCARLAEALRAHSNEEIPLEDRISEFANGFVVGGLSAAIAVLSRSITADVEIFGGAE